MEKKKTRIRRKNGGTKKLLFWFVLLFIVIQIFIKIILPSAITFSRYVYKVARSYYFNTKAFYFNSDKLSEDVAVFEADNWSGIDPYTVTINMNSRKNLEEVSKVNVNYTIKYTCQVFKSSGEEYEDDLIDFVIANTTEEEYDSKNGISKTIFADIETPNLSSFDFTVNLKNNVILNNDDYIFITVTATSTYPYKKTLIGTFKIAIGNPGMSYQIEDKPYSPYLNLIITNTLDYYTVDEAFDGHNAGTTISISDYTKLSEEDKSKCHSMNISLEFNPDELVLDSTSNIYAESEKNNNIQYQKIYDEKGNVYNYANYLKFKIEAEESKVIKFYKITAANDYTYPISNSSEPSKIKVDVEENV